MLTADAWLWGWLAEIGADVREAVAHYKRFAAMSYTNTRLLYFKKIHASWVG